MQSLRLNNNAPTPWIAWAALATVVGVLGATVVGGLVGGANTAVLTGVGAALIAVCVWCVAFLTRKAGG